MKYLQSHADIYHVDASKIALMGWSAGGHLAMLYAYKAAKGELPYGDKIQLVISEAGITDFYTPAGIVPDYQREKIGELIGTVYEAAGWETVWKAASPYWALDYEYNKVLNLDQNIVPYTILMYGNGYLMNGLESDDVLFYAQGKELDELLFPYGKSVLFTFNTNPEGDNNYNHNSFGEDNTPNEQGEYNTMINPKNTYGEIDDYYGKIQEKLGELKES